MHLILTREPSDGMSVRGSLSPLGMATLENLAYLIPPGTYPLEVTYSPRFKRMLPLISNVPVLGSGPATLREYGVNPLPLTKCMGKGCPEGGKGAFRSGIRFHRGSRPEHSKGCILLRTTAEVDHLTSLLQQESCTLTIRNVGD